jgi:patatin-like phospholipase/acyl hydrolase
MEHKINNNDYNILCCDGGGARGMITATFIKTLEENLNIKCSEFFDMFAGTSIGALNSCGIGYLKNTGKELQDYYSLKNLNLLMKQSFLDKTMGLVQLWPKYDGIGKTNMIKEIFGENTFIGECDKDIIIPTYDINNREPRIFTSNLKNNDNNDSLICKILDATSAAPAYYPCVKIGKEWYIDGGVVANNPTITAISKARKYLRKRNQTHRNICVLSIGTGYKTESIDGHLAKKWGGIEWMKNNLIDICMDETIVHQQVSWILDKNHYVRINSKLLKVDDVMDNTTKKNRDNMIELGEKWYFDNVEKLKYFFKIDEVHV